MDYEEAEGIRKKSFGSLLANQEGGFGTSLKKTLSLKSKARTIGIKEFFDPMNMAKKLTGGGTLAPALIGKLFKRDQKSMERFAGATKKTVSNSPEQAIEEDPSSPIHTLGLIYKELVRTKEDKKVQDQLEKNRKEAIDLNQEEQENTRNQQIIEALRGKGLTRKQKKSEVRARRKKEKKIKKEKLTQEKTTPSKTEGVTPPVKTEGVTPETRTQRSTVLKRVLKKALSPTAAKVAAGGAAIIGASGSNAIADIVEVGSGYNVVKRPDGSVEKQVGDRNWRNNNPGNIRYDGVKYTAAANWGAIGTDGEFAIFPSFEIGRQAKAKLIFEGKNYKDLSLTDAIYKYAPPNENDTKSYQQAVLGVIGGQNKIMHEFNEDERTKILNAIQKQEGFRQGKIIPISKTTSTQTSSVKSSDAGVQIDQMSKENKDLKQSSSGTQSGGNVNTSLNVSHSTNETTINSDRPDDRSAQEKKRKG